LLLLQGVFTSIDYFIDSRQLFLGYRYSDFNDLICRTFDIRQILLNLFIVSVESFRECLFSEIRITSEFVAQSLAFF